MPTRADPSHNNGATAITSFSCFRSLRFDIFAWAWFDRPGSEHRAWNGYVLSGLLVGDDPLRRFRQPHAMPTGAWYSSSLSAVRVYRAMCA